MSYYQRYETREYTGYDIKTEAYRHLGMAFVLSTIVVSIMIYLDVPLLLYYIGSFGEFVIILVLLFGGLFRVNFSESTATILLYSFATCSSITLSLLVWIGLALDPLIVAGPVGITTVVTLGAYYFSGQTYEKLGSLSKIATILVIIFLIVGLLGLFFLSNDPVFYLLISAFGAGIFSLYLFIDMARLENRAFSSPALMALWIFYDIIYLLKELLYIFIYLFGFSRKD